MNNTLIGYRHMLGLSQPQLGKLIGMSASAYSKRETGDRQFKQNEMIKIMKVVNAKYPMMTMEQIFEKE